MIYLYHVTRLENLEGIQNQGLGPGSSGKFGGGYAEHSKGRLFLTESAGVSFWHHRITATVIPLERPEETSVVVRFALEEEEEESLEEDVLGTKDATANAYTLDITIEPDRLEVWDGEAWSYLDEVDVPDWVEDVQAAADYEEDEDDEDGEGWYEYDEDLLLPASSNLPAHCSSGT